MYQLFEVKLKPKEIDLQKSQSKLRNLSWYADAQLLVKDDGGLQYILDLSNFTLKCFMGELFPVNEGEWLPEDFPSREEIVNSAINALRKLPFSLEVSEIHRIVKHEWNISQ